MDALLMGNGAAGHWLMAAGILGGGLLVTLVAVNTARRDPAVPPDRIAGFGGWLLLLAIGQCIVAPRLAFQLASQYPFYRQALSSPDRAVMAAGELLCMTAILGFQLWVTMALLRRRRNFPKLFLWQWLAMLAWPVADLFWVHALTDIPLARLVAGIEPARALGQTILSGAWVWYALASVRVRNTFIR